MPETPAADGHRERLKQRFLQGLGTGLADYELLELALTYAIPRRDVKPLAKALITRFKTLGGVLAASPQELAQINGLGPSSVSFLKLVGALTQRVGKTRLSEKPVFANRLVLLDYLYALFADKPREEFHVLYLDAQLKLLADETLFSGTLTQTAAAPRDIIKRALEHNAAGVVVAHNHPSGTPTPSGADLSFTANLAGLCLAMGLTLHDHLIIGAEQHYSFKGAGDLD